LSTNNLKLKYNIQINSKFLNTYILILILEMFSGFRLMWAPVMWKATIIIWQICQVLTPMNVNKIKPAIVGLCLDNVDSSYIILD